MTILWTGPYIIFSWISSACKYSTVYASNCTFLILSCRWHGLVVLCWLSLLIKCKRWLHYCPHMDVINSKTNKAWYGYIANKKTLCSLQVFIVYIVVRRKLLPAIYKTCYPVAIHTQRLANILTTAPYITPNLYFVLECIVLIMMSI